VCGRTPERNDLLCASSSSSLSLSPALNPPQVKEREDSKDAGQNEDREICKMEEEEEEEEWRSTSERNRESSKRERETERQRVREERTSQEGTKEKK
jgi:hypothetical protein